MSHAHDISISVTVTAPFLVQGSEPGAFGIDAVVQRDHDDCPIIPGTLITGKLRDAWMTFNERTLASEWLGQEAADFTPKPGRLCESDLRLAGWTAYDTAWYPPYVRVAIDPTTQAALPGNLQFIEQPWRSGQPLTFNGTWWVIGTDDEVATLCRAIKAGLIWTAQLGAEASIGFGQLSTVTVTSQRTPSRTQPALTGDTRLHYQLRTFSPLMIPDADRGGNNIFVSSDVIPGNALKAAIALTVGAYEGKFGSTVSSAFAGLGMLSKHFTTLRFSHAFPSELVNERYDRPMPVPQSLVAVKRNGADTLYDVSGLKEPYLIHGQAPAFPTDWKDEQWACLAPSRRWPTLNVALRVRTAIENGRSKEAALFAYETQRCNETQCWLGFIDTSGILDPTERALVTRQINELLSRPIGFLGKTKACAALTASTNPQPVWPDRTTPNSDDTWHVMLNTAAAITTAACIAGRTYDEATPLLQAAYADYWSEQSGESIVLSRQFAHQRLAGGEYAWRFRQKQHARPCYTPWLLTLPGSVFVLKAVDGKLACAQEFIDSIAKHGLTLSPAVIAAYSDQWQQNPYLPEHGYGEVSINPQHSFAAPIPADCTSITCLEIV